MTDVAELNERQEDEVFTGRPSSADAIDLLALVRGAEEEATVSASTPDVAESVPPSSPQTGPRSLPPPLPPIEAAGSEEFVDVGDEAVDLPPSLPPMRAHRARVSTIPPAPLLAPARATVAVEPSGRPMSPAVAIVLVLAAVVGILYAILALPSL